MSKGRVMFVIVSMGSHTDEGPRAIMGVAAWRGGGWPPVSDRFGRCAWPPGVAIIAARTWFEWSSAWSLNGRSHAPKPLESAQRQLVHGRQDGPGLRITQAAPFAHSGTQSTSSESARDSHASRHRTGGE